MPLTVMLFGLLATQTPTRKITLNNDTFVIDSPEGAYSVSTLESASSVVWTPDNWKATVGGRTYNFTSRGLSVVARGRTTSVDFSSLATTTKLFTPDEVSTNRSLLASGSRNENPDSLAGWYVSGNTIHLLLRWSDGQGKPWLEALVKLSADDNPSTFALVGRFRGFTTAKGVVSDRLTKAGDVFAAMTTTEDSVGVATLSPTDSSVGFKPIGPKVNDAFFIADSAYGVTRESSPVGTSIISLLDTTSFNFRKAAEVRGEIEGFLQPSIMRYKYLGKDKLLNLASGTELPLPSDCGIGSTPAGVLLWVPKATPRAAALYSSVTFRTLAKWSAP